jgi:hypothetical protein
MSSMLRLTMLSAAVALLGACGSGGDDAPTPPPPAPPPPDALAAVPDSARQSTDGLVIYLKTLTLQTSDTRDPVNLDGVTLPTSDTTEPSPV